MRTAAFLVLSIGVGLVGCKGKDKDKEAPVPSSAPTPAPVAVEPAKPAPEPAKPVGDAVKLAEGEIKTPGCIGWSASKKAAACLAGGENNGQQEWEIQFLGSTTPTEKLGAAVVAAVALRVNDVLAKDGYQPLAGAAEKISDKPTTVKGVELALTSKQTDKGGDNQAPTTKYTLTAKCGGADVAVHENTGEGYALEAGARAAGDEHVIIELTEKIAREGEYSTTASAIVLDTKTCKLVKP